MAVGDTFLQGFLGMANLKAQSRQEEEAKRQFEVAQKQREEEMLLRAEMARNQLEQQRMLAERGYGIQEQGQQQRYDVANRGLDLQSRGMDMQQLRHLEDANRQQTQFNANYAQRQDEFSRELALRQQQEGRLAQQGQQEFSLRRQQFAEARKNGAWQKAWTGADQIMKMTGDPNQAASYVNQNLPGMNLQVTGNAGGWTMMNSAFGPFAFNHVSGEFKPAEGFMVAPTREIRQGGNIVTQELQKGGQWDQIASSPQWKPDQSLNGPPKTTDIVAAYNSAVKGLTAEMAAAMKPEIQQAMEQTDDPAQLAQLALMGAQGAALPPDQKAAFIQRLTQINDSYMPALAKSVQVPYQQRQAPAAPPPAQAAEEAPPLPLPPQRDFASLAPSDETMNTVSRWANPTQAAVEYLLNKIRGGGGQAQAQPQQQQPVEGQMVGNTATGGGQQYKVGSDGTVTINGKKYKVSQ